VEARGSRGIALALWARRVTAAAHNGSSVGHPAVTGMAHLPVVADAIVVQALVTA
jgi:hypothetical protein